MSPLSLLLLVLAARTDTVRVADTATYTSEALRALIAEAVERNRNVPRALGGYRAELESEVSIGNRRAEGVEFAVSLEQIASTLSWDRTGRYEQVVTGYRSQSIVSSLSSLGFFRSGWAIPSMYGNRIVLLVGRDTAETSRRRRPEEPLHAVHPLAADRERYYRFAGGDTTITLRVGDREIPIVRVNVSLRQHLPMRSVVFLGEMDLDAARRHIVRLRGFFAIVGGPKPKFDLLRQTGVQGVAFVEAENAEVDGQFWLPSHQRFEAHVTSSTAGDGRAIFRVVTHFKTRTLVPPPLDLEVGSPGDTLVAHRFRLVISGRDALGAYQGWTTELGAQTATVSAEDFHDVAPDRWSPHGPPRFFLETERPSDVVRVDRVQGVFTGLGGVARFRDALPGFTLRGTAGWAWAEQTARGRVVAEYRRRFTTWSLRAQRSLDLTNDFRSPADSGSTFGALLGRDNFDYLDRESASVHWNRVFGGRQWLQLRLGTGPAYDRAVTVHLARSPFRIGQAFRANRAVREGRYARSSAVLDYRPDVALEFLRPGFGARVSYERGDGILDYQRAEGRFTLRANRGRFSLGMRLDVGVANPDAPPQQFFELGQNQNLPGYAYKEFAGDQAAVLRALAFWRLPYLGAPIRIRSRLWLPPIAPAFALGVQSGWARASTGEALATAIALGSLPTGHPRASVSLTMRFLGGAIGVGIAKPVDTPGSPRAIVEFGQRP